jgi:hypothetical protein
MKTPSPNLTALKSPGNLITVLKVSAIAVSIIALYFQDLQLIFMDAVSDESASHILVIPLILTYLLYRKRKMRFGVTVR